MSLIRAASVALLTAILAGCAAEAGISAGGGYYPQAGPEIPPGHMPPPGECRIWHRDLPPGQQPPPGKCEELQYRVPPNAFLVRG